ncbi:MAG: VOC family protein [bacterium]|nr:glyoxalase [Gammaproteobacteria bacterium]HIL97495.1 glyoxalase [Pseudomonadales bacterium]
MQLQWSHAVIYVRNLEAMLEFYCKTLGFEVTDRGAIVESGPEIIFLSQIPNDHHQLAMVTTRKDDAPSNSVNHFAFRVQAFDDLKSLAKSLDDIGSIKINPLSHGNTLSIYFSDPEQNGIEVFWDTPWHVAQPQGKPWDLSLNDTEALEWVKKEFSDEPGFQPRENYYKQRAIELGKL